MIRCAVLGSPIEHSLSPKIHTRAYQLLGISGQYSRFEVTQGQLGEFLDKHPFDQWRGFSLTMPLKQEGVQFATEISSDVVAAGVLNTLVASTNGWLGFNTDVIAVRNLLRDERFEKVAILGAGGTVRAALAALEGRRCKVQVYRRSAVQDDALSIINRDLEIFDWERVGQAFAADLLINTVPASALVNAGHLSRQPRIILDAIYEPWPPPLALFGGVARYISGKELLVEQGIEQIRLFTGATFDNAILRQDLISTIS